MPTRQRVEEFVAMVVDEKHLEAISEFYHEDASMQENHQEPRKGRDFLLAYETKSHQLFKSMESFPPRKIIVDGDNVAIHWIFEIIDPRGQRRRLEEIAIQKWQSDRIIEEQFFYDSAKAWHPVD